jgi:hypothetical protein
MSELFINPKRIPDSLLPEGWVFDRELSNYSCIDSAKNYNFVYANDDLDVMVMVACDAVDYDFGISVDVGRNPMVFNKLMKTKSPVEANNKAIAFMKACEKFI